MARIRTIKPQFFRHRRLYLAEVESGLPLRVAFAGLWTCADREGRFKWEPEELKLDCLPYDDIDFLRVLDALLTRGFIISYACGDREYGVIPGFKQHQVINNREADSQIPEPPENIDEPDASATREARDTILHEGKGREGKEKDAAKAAPNLSVVPPLSPADLEKSYFDRGKEILGTGSGGLLAKLLSSKQKNVALARAAVEQASTKSNPREYIGAVIRGKPAANEPKWNGIEGVL